MPAALIRFLPALLLGVAFVGLAGWSWGTWCDPIIDFGRELYVPWRLCEGEVLYRDIAWFNGPLSQYWNALVFQLFGVSLRTLMLVNLAIAALATWIVYRLCRHVAGRFAATGATLAFVTICCFLQLDHIANFNWVCPYSHEMTHGVTAMLGAMLAMLRWQRSGGRRWAALAGGLLGLALLTKPEIGLASTVMLAVALILGPEPARSGARRSGLCAAAAAATVPPIVAWALLATAMPAGAALQATLGGWMHVGNMELSALKFYADSLGVSKAGRNLWVMTVFLGVHLAALLPGFAASFLPDAGRAVRRGLAAVLGVAIFLWLVPRNVGWTYAWMPLSAILLACLAVHLLLRRRMEDVEARRTTSAWILLSSGALAMLAKIFFFARLHGYGFGLAALALVVYVLVLLEGLPAVVARWRGDTTAFRVWASALLVFILVGHIQVGAAMLAKKVHVVGSGADSFRTDVLGNGVQAMLGHLQQQPPDATLVVVPEGVMINYLARRRNPARYINFMPPELIMFGEEAIVAGLQGARPDLCIVVHRRTTEYGLSLFGRDYATKILHWLRTQYEPIPDALFGKPPLTHDTNDWGIRLTKRRSP